jgi:hypothetical protein
LALALSGCGGGGKDKAPEAGKGAASPASNGGAPAGGWPQPENGRLTAKMCGLLTDGDYAKYGHQRMPLEDGGPAQNGTNSVECMYMLGDELTLNLQKTAQGAKLAFEKGLNDHKDRLKGKKSVLQSGVVQGADESWFDIATLGADAGEYEVQARRGALLVGITLAGDPQKPAKDPKGTLAGLAGLVLQRLPNVGKSDTGTVHQVTYVVTGSVPKAREVSFYDPVKSKSLTLKNVKLPWRRSLAMPDVGDQPSAALTVSGNTMVPTGRLGCEILVDGKSVRKDPASGFMTLCSTTYHN